MLCTNTLVENLVVIKNGFSIFAFVINVKIILMTTSFRISNNAYILGRPHLHTG